MIQFSDFEIKEPIKTEDFKVKVIKLIKEFNDSPLVDSTCPNCYGAGAILNSHKCSKSWEYLVSNINELGISEESAITFVLKKYKQSPKNLELNV